MSFNGVENWKDAKKEGKMHFGTLAHLFEIPITYVIYIGLLGNGCVYTRPVSFVIIDATVYFCVGVRR